MFWKGEEVDLIKRAPRFDCSNSQKESKTTRTFATILTGLLTAKTERLTEPAWKGSLFLLLSLRYHWSTVVVGSKNEK